MNSHIDCEQFVIKQEDEFPSVTEMKTEVQEMKCEIKKEPENCVKFPDTEQDEADAKDKIVAEAQFISTKKTESEMLDMSDFFHVVLEDDEMKQENTEVDETDPITEDPECLTENSHVANRNIHNVCNISREKVYTCNFTNDAVFQHEEANNLEVQAGNKSKVDKCIVKKKKYSCKLCKKSFMWRSDVDRHVVVHSGHKPFKCNVCGKSYTQKSTLYNHMNSHTGQKHNICKICRKAYLRKSDLIAHMNTHTGQNQFKCDICSKSFIWKSCLYKHFLSHSSEKPFSCVICRKSFTHKTYLSRHLKLHFRVKPYKCGFCNEEFAEKSFLIRHIHVHSGE